MLLQNNQLWQVFSYADVSRILSDPATFSSDLASFVPAQPDLDLFNKGNIVAIDPPRHRKLRTLVSQVSQVFTPRVVAALLGNATLCFDRHPQAAAVVRADRSLLPAAIEEVLRYRSPFPSWLGSPPPTPRSVVTPCRPATWCFRGLQPPIGTSRGFPNPMSSTSTRNSTGHLAFGHGIHFCIGAPLARLEAKIALEIPAGALPRHHGGLRSAGRVPGEATAGARRVRSSRDHGVWRARSARISEPPSELAAHQGARRIKLCSRDEN